MYKAVYDRIIRTIEYRKIGDLTADELTGAVFDDRNRTKDPETQETTYISNYDLFNLYENNVVAPYSNDKRAHNDVDLYRLRYSIDNKGKRDTVTGLLVIPVGLNTKKLPMLSWQHRTTFPVNESPSEIMKGDELQA